MLSNLDSAWIDAHLQEAESLLKTLGKIPAPSHHEEKRAEFILNWLIRQGAKDVSIDSAKNVVLKIGACDQGPVCAVMAHTDVVFSDTDTLPMREEDGRLYAPGIGDDTANLVALLMAAKYILEKNLAPECAFRK